jgi:hypothetical protein
MSLVMLRGRLAPARRVVEEVIIAGVVCAYEVGANCIVVG